MGRGSGSDSSKTVRRSHASGREMLVERTGHRFEAALDEALLDGGDSRRLDQALEALLRVSRTQATS